MIGLVVMVATDTRVGTIVATRHKDERRITKEGPVTGRAVDGYYVWIDGTDAPKFFVEEDVKLSPNHTVWNNHISFTTALSGL